MCWLISDVYYFKEEKMSNVLFLKLEPAACLKTRWTRREYGSSLRKHMHYISFLLHPHALIAQW